MSRSPASLALALSAVLITAPAARADGPAAPTAAAEPPLREAPPADEAWWRAFADPALDTLVDEALAASFDLAAASARATQAEAVAAQGLAPLLPAIAFDASLSASPSANAQFQLPPALLALLEQLGSSGQPAPEDDDDDPLLTWNGSALLNAAWSIDLGRSAAAFDAARLDATAARGDRAGVARLLVAQLVAAWLDVRAAAERARLVRGQIGTNERLLELTRARFTAGDARGLDVLQQEQQLAATRALLPQAEEVLRVRQVQLAVLAGRPADSAPDDVPADLPTLPPAAPDGVDLLADRPELRAASARARAGRARLTSAALSLAPTFRLVANAGWTYRWFDEWTSNETYGFGGSVSVPIFGGGARHAQLQAARAGLRAAELARAQAENQAAAEVATARARELTARARVDALAAQLAAARLAYDESARQYASGLATYLTVLTSLASLQVVELSHLQARRDQLGARVDLHTALGARWARSLFAPGVAP